MDTSSLVSRRARGDAIGERLTDESAAIKKLAKPFLAAHDAFVDAADRVDDAEHARDAALKVVEVADGTLDDSVLELADACVTAHVGTRMKPFGALSKYSPSALVDLGYATEVKAVLALAAALRKKKPSAALAKVIARVEKNARAVDAALKKVSVPQKRYARALAERDVLLPDWDKALRSLHRKVAAETDSDEAARGGRAGGAREAAQGAAREEAGAGGGRGAGLRLDKQTQRRPACSAVAMNQK